MQNKLEVKIECDTSDLDAAQVKASKLGQILKKANSLADELALSNSNIPILN